ncbi:two-component system phosphate regulon sensor histidine kinase PhoR [Catalinimonas alkaloidigena]|uniref:sensor histidine kinase n=1 Tax=Catalinimonas alkaloidigena TaxID=1075417 RepID=UPI0024072465|nr:HAMP domain-containing sensor histidine kinase [Catalinimonas alkaloidigena]MDF9797490.1 two-component system phosphate regulon sensor histidine kinase PhoR [Catalinimonas alkaloidigena]
MNKTLTKIGVVLSLIFVLPAVFFSVYQINSLNKHELIIEEIYNNQLDAILFSVNQYSTDVLSAWASEVDLLLEDSTFFNSQRLATFFAEKNSIQYLIAIDSADYANIYLFNEGSGRQVNDSLGLHISETLNQRKALIERLFSYLDNGYRKIEPISILKEQDAMLQIFLPQGDLPTNYICGFIITPSSFIQNVLGPKIQAISQEKFVISAFRGQDNSLIYTSDGANNNMHQLNPLPFWLFPDYYLSINLNGQTIETLAHSRLINDIILIIGLDFILLLGVWFVYRNVKREIELAQIKSDFVSNVSHELRTPLSLISMFAETLMLNRIKTEERKQEYYKIISQETVRLTAMVNKILNFSKIEAGQRKYNLKTLDLNELIREVVEAYEFHLSSQGFKYAYFSKDDEMLINGDAEAITEALINLLDNAIKYSPEHKEIAVSTGITDQYFYVEVTDKGLGISDGNQNVIFDKFFRGSGSQSVKGTGLGLSLVKHIMEAHHGKVELISNLGEGSTFRLCFPIRYKVTKLLENS